MKPIRMLTILALSIALLGAEDEKKPEVKAEIVVAHYARSDGTKKENRVFVLGQTVYRSLAALKEGIAGFSGRPPNLPALHFEIFGQCDALAPGLDANEIDELKEACAKAGVRFTYHPAG